MMERDSKRTAAGGGLKSGDQRPDPGPTWERAEQLLGKLDSTTGYVRPLLLDTERIGATYQKLATSVAELSESFRSDSGGEDSDVSIDSVQELLRETERLADKFNTLLLTLGRTADSPELRNSLGIVDEAVRRHIDYIFVRVLALLFAALAGLATILVLRRLLKADQARASR